MIETLRDDLMVQEQIKTPWEHMVGVIMLNQTGRKPVKSVLPRFLNLWSDPEKFLSAHHMTVKKIIKPLGMSKVRYHRLKNMTKDYMTWDGHDATKLYGIGKYGSDSYEIFFKKNYDVRPTDKELKRYLKEEVFTKEISR